MFKKSLLIMLLVACMAPWAAGQGTVYQKVTQLSEITDSGKYILVNEANARVATTEGAGSSGNYISSESITFTNGVINSTDLPEKTAYLTIKEETTSNYSITNNKAYYLYVSYSSSSIRFRWHSDTQYKNWHITFTNGNVTISRDYSSTQTYYVYYAPYGNTYYRFTAGTSETSGSIALYKETVASNYPAPRNLTVTSTTAHEATLTWTSPSENLTGYAYQYKKTADETWSTLVEVGSSVLTCTINNLDAETSYDFRVKAIYEDDPEINFATTSFTTDAACPAPTGLAVTASGTTVTVTWTGSSDSYDVYYNTTGVAPDASTTPNYSGITSTSQNISNLSVDNTYYVWVRSNCTGEDPSSWTGSESVTIQYCIPNLTGVDGQGITNVTFGMGTEIVNNNERPISSPYYGNYSAQIGAVEKGTRGEISITYSTGSNTVYSYGTLIWVDWNNNLTFEDNEIVYTGTSAQGTGGVPQLLEAYVDVPAAQNLGYYRMRIAGADSYFDSYIGGNSSASHDPCFTNSYAICHDYTIHVIEGNSCQLVPSNFNFSESYTSATATWVTDGGVSCDIYYSSTNSAPANDVELPSAQTGIEGTNNSYSYNITDLSANTLYYVWVRANCAANERGNWVSAGSFTTLNYDVPTNVHETTVTYNTARVEWEAPHSDIVSYTYQYKAGNDAWTSEATTTNLYVELSGLTASTTYTFRVKANYPTNASSEFAEDTFDTPEQYATPTGLAASNIKTTGATLTWNVASGATGYNLRYRSIPEGTQVGNDITTEYSYQQYDFDLSGFTGTGRIAIRHYNCSGKYYLAVDDVEVTNSNNDVVLSEGFEGSAMPSGWTVLDKDSDTYNWAQYSPSDNAHEGSGVVYSESYKSSTNSNLNPDNWLLTPEVELGGQISLWARGTNSYDYDEVFGIYVIQSEWITENGLAETTKVLSSLTGSTGYESQVQAVYSGDNSAWSNTLEFTTLPLMRYTGTQFYQSWASTTAWTPNGTPTANHDVVIEQASKISAGNAVANNITINAGASLNIQSSRTLTCNNITNNGNLIIEDGGQLFCNNNPVITANKTTSAWNTTDKGWYLISSPVNTPTVASVAQGTYNMYYYDEPTMYWMNDKVGDNGETVQFANLTNGLGYLYRSTVANTSFTGAANVGPVEYTLSYTEANGDYAGFNLIGNPYPHSIYKGVAIPSDKLVSQYCVLTTTGTWTLTNDNVAIAPMQAVLVQATSAGNIEIADNAAAPVGKYGNDNIWFTVKNNEFTDVACVEFKEGHGFNKPEHRNENAPMLYIINNGERFASACMPDNTSVINLGFEAKTMGEYTISLNAEGQYSYMHLIDKLTGEDIDMLVEDSYTFIGSQNDRKDRFVLNLNYNAAGIDSESDIFAYQSGSDIIVSGEGELQVFDITGRKVMTTNINGVETINGMNTGVYIFRMNGKAQKIVIR